MLKTAARRLAPPAIKRARDQQVAARIDRKLCGEIFSSRDQLDAYRRELETSGLLEHLDSARRDFQLAIHGHTRGHAFGFGAITDDARRRLYALLRARR